MKKLTLLFIFVLLTSNTYACDIQAYFSPKDNIEQVILDDLSKAKKSVHLSLYGITNQPLADKLIELQKAGVDVILCEDKLQSSGPHDLHADFEKNGIKVAIKKTGTLEHNKFVIIDNTIVIMGSWNWSDSAQKQDNSDVVIMDCPDQVKKFEDAFQRILQRDTNE